MTEQQAPNRIRQIASQYKLEDFTKEAAPTVSRILERIYDEVSKDRIVKDMITPQNFIALNKCNSILLTWDEPDETLRQSVYGVRIWRCLASADPNPIFDENNAKRILAWLVLTTNYTDALDDLQQYMYWVQWVNLDGSVSNPAGGIVSSGDVGNYVYLTDAATIAVNGALGQKFHVTLSNTIGATRQIQNATNLVDGQQLFFRLIQSAAGGNAVTWDTMYHGTIPAVSSGAGLRDYFNFIYCEYDNQIDYLGNAVGF